MRSVIRHIEFCIIGIIMWAGWIPIAFWRFGIFSAYKAAGDIEFASKLDRLMYVLRVFKYSAISDPFSLIPRLVAVFIIYVLLLFILGKFRRVHLFEFYDDDDYETRGERVSAKSIDADVKKENKEVYGGLFKSTVPLDSWRKRQCLQTESSDNSQDY